MIAIHTSADIYNSQMQSASDTEKTSLLTFYETLRFTSSTPDFNAGFTKINQTISASTTGCNGIILFLTAGMNGTSLSAQMTTFASSLNSS
jgi:hypothetical protein